MVSNERNHKKTEKEIPFPAKSFDKKQGIIDKDNTPDFLKIQKISLK